MKVKANTKDNTVEFIPEKDIDSYQLGMVFGHKSHSLTLVPPNKIKKMTIKVNDMWAYLLEININA